MTTVPPGRWRKARASAQQANCVELAHSGAVRDSKNPAGPHLTVNVAALVSAVKAGAIR